MIVCERPARRTGRTSRPVIDDATRILAAVLVVERLHEHLNLRKQLRARPSDGQWAHFFDLHGAIVSERSQP